MDLRYYTPAKKAAKEIGISYSLLMSRIYNGKIKAEKVDGSWAVFISNAEVKRVKKEEAKRRTDASNKGVEGAAG